MICLCIFLNDRKIKTTVHKLLAADTAERELERAGFRNKQELQLCRTARKQFKPLQCEDRVSINIMLCMDKQRRCIGNMDYSNVFCNNATYTLYQILYSLLSGWVSCGNWTHWEIINAITNAGDKSAEVSALEEGRGISQEQHLLVCSC